MTTDQLHRANQLNQKVESTKALLQKLEGGRIKTVTVHVFDDEQALYEVLDLTDIPRNQIKLILLEKAKKDYENAKEKFAYYLSENANPIRTYVVAEDLIKHCNESDLAKSNGQLVCTECAIAD